MVSEIVVVDKRVDSLLSEQPSEAVRLMLQEYQITHNKELFVAALIAKLVFLKTMQTLK